MNGIISLYNVDGVTEKQQKVIGMIEYYCCVKFEGSTKQEARKFISDHIHESRIRADEARFIKRQRADEFWDSLDDEFIHEETGMTEYEEYLQESYAGFTPLDFCNNY